MADELNVLEPETTEEADRLARKLKAMYDRRERRQADDFYARRRV